MAHMADYAHCSNVKASAHMMDICKRSAAVAPPTHTAATLMAAGVRSGNVTLTFNNQLGGRVGATTAQVVNGLAVRERSAAYDAHFQAASAAQLVPGTLLPVPSYSATSPNAASRVVAVGGPAGIQQYVPVTMVEQGGRLMVGATWAAPSGRQMTLVPSWQQLPHPQTHAHALAQQPTHGTLLVPAEADWRRPLLDNATAQGLRIAQDQMFPVVYDRNSREARSGSYSSGSKRSTGYKQQPQHQQASSSSSSNQRQLVKKETAVTQLSPVKKRIKENKDHYIVADKYPGQRPSSWDKVPAAASNNSRPHEVITISDSEDEDKAPAAEPSSNATPATPNTSALSNCPSVMTLTPQQSAPPPPTASPTPEAASRPESQYLKTPIKLEVLPGQSSQPAPTPGMSQKKRLLAKAQSDWTLAEAKPEPAGESQTTQFPPGASSSLGEREKLQRFPSASNLRYSSYDFAERGERQRSDRFERADRTQERSLLEREERLLREREARDREAREREVREREAREREAREREAREREVREREVREREAREQRERAELDYQAAAMAARERDLREQLSCIVPRLELAPPLAHQPEYGLEHGGLHRGVEYIQPPAAHSNRDLLAIHRGSQHYGSPASHHPDNLYAPATVYVTAAGYQQIAIPPPAHHARPLVPPQAAVFQVNKYNMCIYIKISPQSVVVWSIKSNIFSTPPQWWGHSMDMRPSALERPDTCTEYLHFRRR